ncbi:MerR family transcriptional regulator [Kribbella qitaiheensis]|uniref:MerR family transcriptional regulator n=1 Tax=Kribbella qitaiheensis TaxID=1544730 RepID=A0A7G6WT27_9ACTN|nr:MerR family transcriptional regulator [Kribbella qitaiheensis]QNE17142.1 MerR family transcriptional regulator [Kribbella qitaiheensis]
MPVSRPLSPVPAEPSPGAPHEATLTVDELSARVGMTVRTLRFYAGRGLIPPPVRRGRVGYYGPEHIARLDLVRELQAHGFTLSAIEGYLDRIPADATPQDIALHRTLLTPWMRDLPETLDRTALVRRTGRELSDDDIEMLVALGVVEPTPDEDVFQVATAHLSLGVELLDLDLPVDAVLDITRIFHDHGRALAEELTDVFRAKVWPHYRASGGPPEHIQQLVERFKPVTIQGLVLAYERAVSETQRDTIRRTRTKPPRR